MKNSIENFNNLEKDINVKVSYAKEHAIQLEEFDRLKMEGDLDSVNIQKIKKATISVETLPEARLALQILGFLNYEALDIIEHENAHANKADELGTASEYKGLHHEGYNFIVINRGDGIFEIQPQARVYIPDEWSQEKQNAATELIAQAPEEYGNALSESDVALLKKLREGDM